MLPPDYYNEISQGAEAVAEELHENIIRKIIRRLIARMKRYKFFKLSQTDKWAIETLQESGYLREDIAKEIAKMTGRQARTIRKTFEEAAVKNLEWDDAVYRAAGLSPDPLKRSPFLIRLLQRGYEKTNHEWFNYTRTTADAAQRLFISECDKAYNLVATGAESLQTAVADAVEKISSNGVEVVYPSGHRDTIETATARAVRTGAAQACGEITTARMDEFEWDIVLVSAHLGARVTDREDFTNHYWWQGKFYSRSGKDPRFPPFSVCGEGNVQGILGANCRHSYSPGDGENNPFEHFDSEENKKRYQNEQRQRAMERAIRKTKRELIGLKEGIDAAGDDEALKAELQKKYDRKAVTLKNQFDRYEEFSKENGLKMQYDRANIAGWDKTQAKAATKAAKKELEKYEKYHYNEDGTIIVTDDWTGKVHPSIPSTYKPYAVIDTLSQSGRQRERTIFDENGRQKKQISTGAHGNPKRHPFGINGEHAHDVIWEDDVIVSRKARDLNETEKKENADIL